MRLRAIVHGIALAAASCGNGAAAPAETLTCEWLAGPDNCWGNTAAMAATCLPPEADTGTISADNATCTYVGGPIVTFNPPLVFPFPEAAEWNFTITDASGAQCLRYEHPPQGGTTLVVGDQTVRTGGSDPGLSITCPDGTSVQTSDGWMLLDCPGSSPTMLGLPGLRKTISDSVYSAGILTGAGTSVPVFRCRK